MKLDRPISLAICLWWGIALQAASIGVILDTSGLPPGSFSLDMQLLDGDGVVNNSVTLQNFAFNGLTFNALSRSGNATGSPATFIAISDDNPAPDPFSGALQGFTASAGPTSIQLVIIYSENFAGGFPDTISISLLDGSLTALAWLTLDLGTPSVLTKQSGGGAVINTSFDVPEPGLPWTVALGTMLVAKLRSMTRDQANARANSR